MADPVTDTSPPSSSSSSSSSSSPSFYSLFGTPPPSHQSDGGANNRGDDEPSPTQPFSFAGEVSGLNGGDTLRDEITDSLVNNHDDDKMSAVFDSSDDERHCKINLSNRGGVVSWEDAAHVIQHTSKLSMDFHVDTSEQRALFVLHAPVYLKVSTPNCLVFRLIMYPENIRSIEFDPRTHPPTSGMANAPNKFMRLRFLMTQPPSLAVPKDRSLEPKPRSRDLFEALKSLATVQELNIYLDKLCFVPEVRNQLSLLPTVFSSTYLGDRPKTDADRSNLQVLHKGLGAIILDMGATAAGPDATLANTAAKQVVHETIEVVAPPYTKDDSLQSPAQVITPSDRKRRRTSESLSPSTTDKRIFTAFAQLAKRHADLQSRVAHLEKMVADSRCDHTPCRYGTEEMEHIIGHVDDKIDNDMDNVRWELEDKVFGETRELVVEKTEEQQSQLWADMRDGLMDEMRQEIKEELKAELRQELAAEIKKELFKDMAQAMMRAACGNGEKSGASMSQSTQSTDSTE